MTPLAAVIYPTYHRPLDVPTGADFYAALPFAQGSAVELDRFMPGQAGLPPIQPPEVDIAWYRSTDEPVRVPPTTEYGHLDVVFDPVVPAPVVPDFVPGMLSEPTAIAPMTMPEMVGTPLQPPAVDIAWHRPTAEPVRLPDSAAYAVDFGDQWSWTPTVPSAVGLFVSTNSAEKGIQPTESLWIANPDVEIHLENYKLRHGYRMEISITQKGGTGDAGDITVIVLVVME